MQPIILLALVAGSSWSEGIAHGELTFIGIDRAADTVPTALFRGHKDVVRVPFANCQAMLRQVGAAFPDRTVGHAEHPLSIDFLQLRRGKQVLYAAEPSCATGQYRYNDRLLMAAGRLVTLAVDTQHEDAQAASYQSHWYTFDLARGEPAKLADFVDLADLRTQLPGQSLDPRTPFALHRRPCPNDRHSVRLFLADGRGQVPLCVRLTAAGRAAFEAGQGDDGHLMGDSKGIGTAAAEHRAHADCGHD